MKRVFCVLFSLLPVGAIAGELPCAREAVPFLSVPSDRESVVTLEAERVIFINGKTLTYSLGKDTITITANSFAAERFLEAVASGRCSARETVRLVPVRQSPFNDRFHAKRPF